MKTLLTMTHIQHLYPIRFPYQITLITLAILLLSSCTTTQLVEEPVTDLNKRYEFEMFSILPPQGDGWILILSKEQGSKALLMFGKQVKPGTPLGIKTFQPHTIRAGVAASHAGDEDVGSPQEFHDMIKQSEKANTSSRFHILKEAYSTYKKLGEYCVFVEKRTEDSGVPNDPGKTYIYNENKLFCYDKKSQIMARASCSQRAPNKDVIINIEDECRPFIDSFKFK